MVGRLVRSLVDRDGNGKPDQAVAINEHDAVETSAERLLPGQSRIERLRYILERSNAALVVPVLAVVGRGVYLLSPLEHAHFLIWLALAVYLVWVGIEHLNALPYVKTWSVFSAFLFGLVAGVSIAVQMGWL